MTKEREQTVKKKKEKYYNVGIVRAMWIHHLLAPGV